MEVENQLSDTKNSLEYDMIKEEFNEQSENKYKNGKKEQINKSNELNNSHSTKSSSDVSSLVNSTKLSFSKEISINKNKIFINSIINKNYLELKDKDKIFSKDNELLEEIYTNLLIEQNKITTKPEFGYLDNQNEINIEKRAILVNWIIEIHFHFQLRPETLFLSIWIIDTYLSNHFISLNYFQLLGVASLFISCKYNEINFPEPKQFIKITKDAYEFQDLLEMENHILKTIKFNIFYPQTEEFYNILAKIMKLNDIQKYFGKYFLESTLIDYKMIKYNPSVIAIACIYIAMKFFKLDGYKSLYENEILGENCPKTYIKKAAREICFLVKNLSTSPFDAVKKKYSTNLYCNVTKYCE